MGKSKLKGKDLRKINYRSNKARSLAIDIISKHFKHIPKEEVLELLEAVLHHPENYLSHDTLAPLAEEFAPVVVKSTGTSYKLRDEPAPYRVYGRKFITQNAIRQMDVAMQLPIAVQGALMPDAHVGYGLPIGGVLATSNAVIPYGVGLDIGCRMSLSIYDVPADFIQQYRFQVKKALQEQTHFGIGKLQDTYEDHAVLERQEFRDIDVLRQLHGKAKGQIGTSGSGNHFVECGTLSLKGQNPFGLRSGNYVAVLAHSGSRGFGAAVANFYTKVALDSCWLPQGAKHLAWLDLDSEAGQEYWLAMNLAGDYAQACHDVIHRKIGKALGLKPAVKVENHHNFAWKEPLEDGRQAIVHRKGATPAQKGKLGIIPATMLEPGYLVMGKGSLPALQSASHGAGRKMSRGRARESFTRSSMLKALKGRGITLIGGGTDEAPMAYKNIEEVMKSQEDLVDIIGAFQPQVVKMDKA